MKESVDIAKEANRKQGSSPTRSDNNIQRLRNGPERQLGALRDVIGNIRRNGGVPSVESIATELSVMPSSDRASALLALQQTHGNQYVQRVVTGVRAKLNIGQPGDIYEQEADRVAEQVMQMPEPQVQRQPEEEEEEPIQTELNGSIQRQPEEENEEELVTPKVQEKLTMGSPGDVYEQEADRVAEAISTEGGLSDLSNMASVQQKLLSSLDPRALGGFTERTIKPMVSTDTVGSKKLSVNRKQELPPQGDGSVPASIESRILQSKGRGNPLPQHMQNYMAIQAGYDFNNVRVKADSEAAELNSALGARAFTNGSDIWLGRGEKVTDVKLMAHELTHVVQQGGARRIQPQSNAFSSILTSKGFMPKFMQTLTKNTKGNSALFQKGILQFIRENSSERMTALQSKIIDNSRSDMLSQKENAQTLRGSINYASFNKAFSSASFNKGTGGAITATPGGSSVRIKSAPYSTSGKVKVSGVTNAQAKNWEAGFIQTITASQIKAHYKGSTKQKLWTVSVPCPKRDALEVGGAPWYDPNNANGPGKVAFKKTNSSVSVLLWDKPSLPTPWKTPDGKGKLSHTEGKDVFTAWMIARKKTAPNTIHYINRTSWEVDYGATFNYASKGIKTVKNITGKTKNTGFGAGKGSTTPTLSGKIANKSISTVWT